MSEQGTSKRSVGFCLHDKCEEYMSGIFLLRHKGPYRCHKCKQEGREVLEIGKTENAHLPFRTVKVEFNYNPFTDSYKDVAIIINSAMPEGAIYRFSSPLVRTEKRALLMAESMLANLTTYGHNPKDGIPEVGTLLLEMDDNFSSNLRAIAGNWR